MMEPALVLPFLPRTSCLSNITLKHLQDLMIQMQFFGNCGHDEASEGKRVIVDIYVFVSVAIFLLNLHKLLRPLRHCLIAVALSMIEANPCLISYPLLYSGLQVATVY
ncbi:hypothetical protein Dimus_017697 [Dionaea muscipula]